MGLFDMFSKEGRTEAALKRAAAKAIHKHIQSPDRMKALDDLYRAGEEGSEEAIYALLKRFSFVYDKTIEDEQEKDWTYNAVCSLGEKALEPVRRYIMHADSISWPLRILEKTWAPAAGLRVWRPRGPTASPECDCPETARAPGRCRTRSRRRDCR